MKDGSLFQHPAKPSFTANTISVKIQCGCPTAATACLGILPVMGKSKIQSVQALKARVREAQSHKERVVLTNGCFDVLHRGHLELLYHAKALGDILIVAINNDESVRKIKGPGRPINSEMDRAEMLAAMEMVDYVTLFETPDPYDLIAELLPDVLVKGGDWQVRDVIGGDVVLAHGGQVNIVPLVANYSSTGIIEKIRRGKRAREKGSGPFQKGS